MGSGHKSEHSKKTRSDKSEKKARETSPPRETRHRDRGAPRPTRESPPPVPEDQVIGLDSKKIPWAKESKEYTPEMFDPQRMVQSALVPYTFTVKDKTITAYRGNYYYRDPDTGRFQKTLMQEQYDEVGNTHLLESYKGVTQFVDDQKQAKAAYSVSFKIPPPIFTRGEETLTNLNLSELADEEFETLKAANLCAEIYLAYHRSCELLHEDMSSCGNKLEGCESIRDVKLKVKCPIYIPQKTVSHTLPSKKEGKPGKTVTKSVPDYTAAWYITTALDCFTFVPKDQKDKPAKEQESKFVMNTRLVAERLDGDGQITEEPIDPLEIMGMTLKCYPVISYQSMNLGATLKPKLVLNQAECVTYHPPETRGNPRVGQRFRARLAAEAAGKTLAPVTGPPAPSVGRGKAPAPAPAPDSDAESDESH